MSTVDIFNEFNRIIQSAFPLVTIGYAGTSYTPPDDAAWLEVRPNWIGSEEYAVGNLAVERGFFRILVCNRLGKGLATVQQLAEQVIIAVPKGSTFGGAITDSRPSLSGPIEYDDKLVIPVTIRWRATRN